MTKISASVSLMSTIWNMGAIYFLIHNTNTLTFHKCIWDDIHQNVLTCFFVTMTSQHKDWQNVTCWLALGKFLRTTIIIKSSSAILGKPLQLGSCNENIITQFKYTPTGGSDDAVLGGHLRKRGKESTKWRDAKVEDTQCNNYGIPAWHSLWSPLTVRRRESSSSRTDSRDFMRSCVHECKLTHLSHHGIFENPHRSWVITYAIYQELRPSFRGL